MKRLFSKTLPLHPFLLSLYPAFALLAYNIKEMAPASATRSLVYSFIAVIFLFILTRLITRNTLRAGLVTSILVLLFFSYGHVYDLFHGTALEIILGKQSILAIIYLVLFISGAYWALRLLKGPVRPTRILNVFAAVLLIFPSFQIVSYSLQTKRNTDQIAEKYPVQQKLIAPAGQPLPDVYFIILDTYARQDLLKDQFHLDNTAFVSQLQQLGFTVERCSQSNYTQTKLSLASILNFAYLPTLDPSLVSGDMDRSVLEPVIKESLVRRSLQGLGYQTVSFETGYSWSEISNADIYYHPGTDSLARLGNSAGLNQFESMFVRTTAGKLLTTIQTSAFNDFAEYVNHPFQDHIAIQEFLLDTLGSLSSVAGPKFVFSHILIPHGPFVFGPEGVLPTSEMIGSTQEDGSDLTQAQYIQGYVPQVEYINNRILPILEDLIHNSKTPPIIVLEGDHGPFSEPPILNAIYLPGGKDIGLYPTETPVNTFRLIFNGYFGTHYPLLPDLSYQSYDSDPFGGKIYPNTCK